MPFKMDRAVQEQEGEEKPILHLAESCTDTIFIEMLYDGVVVICPVPASE